jgi:hypothetical protein
MHTAAVAGIVWAANPKCTNAEIRAALQKSAVDRPPAKGRDIETGFGLANAAIALTYLAKNKCRAYLPPSPPPKKLPSPPPKKVPAPPTRVAGEWKQCGGKGGDCGKVPGLACKDAAVLCEPLASLCWLVS